MKVKNLDRIISVGPAFSPLKMGFLEKKNRPLFIMMSGIPGSGKSTKAKEIAKKLNKSEILSSDKYREKITGDINDMSRDEEVFNTLYKDMHKFLVEGKSVIYDATNMNIKDRRRALEVIRDIDCYKISHLMNVNFEECKKRNFQRDRVLPEEVLYKFLYKFEVPQPDSSIACAIDTDLKIELQFSCKSFIILMKFLIFILIHLYSYYLSHNILF